MKRRRSTTGRFYFSFRSPYSWVAYRDLMDRYPDVAGAIEWRPFWEPDASSERGLAEAGGHFAYVAMSKEKHLYVLQDVRRITRERDLAFRWPVDRDPCWEIPHLAYLVAVREGRGPEFIAAVYRARWEEGRNICDPRTMRELAAETGLDGDRLAEAADDPDLRAAGVDALLELYHDGVFGVPFFVSGFDKFWGVDRLPGFVEKVRRQAGTAAGEDRRPVAVLAGGESAGSAWSAGDQGHAGGCG
ncbi:2-hydroxychromene-2-carboxylate isomerase [Streptomyces sp. TS71-3]|uniref:2-hydroxychromene-2-carboxylate isomerase n=1 Tax=Streptomyces sp. TS71-3 TaxID=2733862 RepID=UPI001B2E702E|nr:2-hydroxychromene-2-carboxylate isomerase [Streptomyces sp. TS71-3]GHJ36854.1 2-hydroxychromene-2-carboxylate isomerase [Streptomyces sp. TS71-3]